MECLVSAVALLFSISFISRPISDKRVLFAYILTARPVNGCLDTAHQAEGFRRGTVVSLGHDTLYRVQGRYLIARRAVQVFTSLRDAGTPRHNR
jgi:hypothetical protein